LNIGDLKEFGLNKQYGERTTRVLPSGAGRWSNRLYITINFSSGWTFAIWLFLFIFIKSFLIELQLPGGGFSTPPPSAILVRYAPPEFEQFQFQEK